MSELTGNMLVGWLVMEIAVNLTINIWLGIKSTSLNSITKGILERVFLVAGILFGYPHVITAFGALKIGTRLHEDQKSKISNDYFLIGNFISILGALTFAFVCIHFWGWDPERF